MAQKWIGSSSLGRCKWCGDEVWVGTREVHAHAECVAVTEPGVAQGGPR